MRNERRVYGMMRWSALVIGAGLALETAAGQDGPSPGHSARRLTFVILGTGITAPDAKPSWGQRLQRQIDSAQLPFVVSSAGRYAESSVDALRRVDSLIARSMDVFLLETGSEDAARGLSADSTRANVRAILHRVRAAHPESWVFLVREIPPTALPAQDTAAFRALYGALGRSEQATILPSAADSLWPELAPVLHRVASVRTGH